MTNLTGTKSIELIAEESHDFGLKDKKGRAMGVRTYLRVLEQVPVPGGQTYGSPAAPGTYYRANTDITRNGSWFGASTRAFETTDRAEAEAWLARRVEVARKGAIKTAAKV